MKTLGDVLEQYTKALDHAGSEDARMRIVKLLSNMTGLNPGSINSKLNTPFQTLGLSQDSVSKAVNRLIDGEPLEYITGYAWFYNEKYSVVPGVLIPRPDTELLVESALQFCGALDFPAGDVAKIPFSKNKQNELFFADLCTGSGCVGISTANALVKSGKTVDAYLVDIDDTALSCCQGNIESSANPVAKLEVVKADILKDSFGKADVILDFIVSNPPYVTLEEMGELDRSVSEYEPHLALFGGDDGLDFYRRICLEAKKRLKNGGALIVEHGFLQGKQVRDIFKQAGYQKVMTLKDYGANDRVTFGLFGEE